jgi:hypothetical protein
MLPAIYFQGYSYSREAMRYFIPFTLISVATATVRDGLAPLFKPQHIIPDSYIVKFKDGVSADIFDAAVTQLMERSHQVYETVFNGFAATLDAAAVGALRRHPHVRPR